MEDSVGYLNLTLLILIVELGRHCWVEKLAFFKLYIMAYSNYGDYELDMFTCNRVVVGMPDLQSFTVFTT